MRRLLIALVIGVIAWQAWGAYQTRHGDEKLLDDSEESVTAQVLDQETCAPKILDPRRTDAVAGPSPACGRIMA
jgi:hypothetical protein